MIIFTNNYNNTRGSSRLLLLYHFLRDLISRSLVTSRSLGTRLVRGNGFETSEPIGAANRKCLSSHLVAVTQDLCRPRHRRQLRHTHTHTHFLHSVQYFIKQSRNHLRQDNTEQYELVHQELDSWGAVLERYFGIWTIKCPTATVIYAFTYL